MTKAGHPLDLSGIFPTFLTMSLTYADPMALLHGFSIWLCPATPVMGTNDLLFHEMMWGTIVQTESAPTVKEAKLVFRPAKVLAPRDFTYLELFLEKYTVVSANLLGG